VFHFHTSHPNSMIFMTHSSAAPASENDQGHPRIILLGTPENLLQLRTCMQAASALSTRRQPRVMSYHMTHMIAQLSTFDTVHTWAS
jgi:hypothetical protein